MFSLLPLPGCEFCLKHPTGTQLPYQIFKLHLCLRLVRGGEGVVVINYQLIKLIIDPTFSIKLLINYYNKFYPLQYRR